jgi:hypothetical protein
MKGLRILFFAVFLVLVSCGGEEASIPKHILPQAKMQAVMWDMMRADELADLQVSLDSSLDRQQKSLQLYASIFSIHKISERSFKESFAFYQKHPAQLKIVFDSLRQRTERPPTPSVVKPG